MLDLRSCRLVMAAPLMVLLALVGCTNDLGPLGLEPEGGAPPEQVQALLTCKVDLQASTMSCASPKVSLPAGISGALLGGQGTYLLLESSNVAYNAAATRFSADITIQNRLMQALGTADGTTVHGDGIRIFFLDAPEVTVGTGQVVVANADDKATFTGPNQSYFQYNESLLPGKRSASKTWEWNVPATVEEFTFRVGVSAAVPDEGAIVPGIGLDAATFALGLSHTCGLSYRGELYCWGDGSKGQFGNGKEHGEEGASALVPTRTPWSGEPFASLATFADQLCALTASGKAYCWGDAEGGSLGDGHADKASLPVEVVAPGKTFVSVTVGGSFSCAVTDQHEAYCWGDGGTGEGGVGVLGNGTTDFAGTPVPVTQSVPFASISGGMMHVCALSDAGHAYCWGDGEDGNLGNNTTDGSLVPVPVVGGLSFSQLSVGGLHTCALESGSGDLYCWGHGAYGQLGQGAATASSVPVQVAWSGSPFVSLSAGGAHTCALTQAGEIYCWGSGAIGQLGNGASFDLGDEKIDGLPPITDVDEATPTPISWSSGERFVSVSAGIFHTCATTAGGQTYCWGLGHEGQLGNGSKGEKSVPTLVDSRLRLD